MTSVLSYLCRVVALCLVMMRAASAEPTSRAPEASIDWVAEVLDEVVRDTDSQGRFFFKAPVVGQHDIRWDVSDGSAPSRTVGVLTWRRHSRLPSKRVVAGGVLSMRGYMPYPELNDLLVSTGERLLSAEDELPAMMADAELKRRPAVEPRLFGPVGAGLFALGLAAVVAGVRRKSGPQVEWMLKPNHLLPAILQSSIFLYWGMYDDRVVWYAPYLLLQLVFAYVADALLAWTFDGKWRVGAGPLPVVLSTNLFAWYLMPWKAALVITFALASKYLFRYKDGQVMFNPSGVALCFMAVSYIVAPQLWSFNGVVHQLSLPPNMSEWILLIALIPQWRFPLVLVSVGSVCGLLMMRVAIPEAPGVVLPSTVLAFTLLITEPRTMAKTGWGRLIQGLAFGVLVVLSADLFHRLQLSDDFAKVLPIPLVNLLVRPIDRFVEKLPEILRAPLEVKWNKVHVLAFSALMVFKLFDEKEQTFLPQDLWLNESAILVAQEGHAGTCEENPAYCQPFGFYWELRQWQSRWTDDQDRPSVVAAD